MISLGIILIFAMDSFHGVNTVKLYITKNATKVFIYSWNENSKVSKDW